jgi:hypothetical protein
MLSESSAAHPAANPRVGTRATTPPRQMARLGSAMVYDDSKFNVSRFNDLTF